MVATSMTGAGMLTTRSVFSGLPCLGERDRDIATVRLGFEQHAQHSSVRRKGLMGMTGGLFYLLSYNAGGGSRGEKMCCETVDAEAMRIAVWRSSGRRY